MSLTTIGRPPIELHILMFDVNGQPKLLGGSRFTYQQQNNVFENITKGIFEVCDISKVL